MPQSHCELWVHLIWATKGRERWLKEEKRFSLIEHIRSIGIQKDYHVDIVNGIEDHLHALVAFKASHRISRIVNDIKGESSHWINERNLFELNFPFRWQGGYAAFTVNPKNVEKVRSYILKQKEYHKTMSLDEELEKIKNSE